MDFAPGERWLCNNSGYILLGAVIEKVSGQSYEDFVRTKIFEPLGMKNSYYDRTERVIPRRVKGYQQNAGTFQNAPYLSMSQPYAAGSLASNVDDLAIWNSALWTGKLVKKQSLAKAHTAQILKDGRGTAYGYGWSLGSCQGHRSVEHGGGIHGFATYVLSLPDDDIYAAILTNGSAGPGTSPEDLAFRMAAIALGQPAAEPEAITLRPEQVDRCTGVYAIDDKERSTITREGAQLYSQRSGGEKRAVYPVSETEFFFRGSTTRLVFLPDASGRITLVQTRPRVGMMEEAKRIEEKIVERAEVPVSPAILERYVGTYELAPTFKLTVTLENGNLMTQATGQAKVQVFPETATKFFLKVTNAQIEFLVDEAGNIGSLKPYQGGHTMSARKVKE